MKYLVVGLVVASTFSCSRQAESNLAGVELAQLQQPDMIPFV